MGNTITNCCHPTCEETSSPQFRSIRSNSKSIATPRGLKFGKKKSVKFADSKKSGTGRRSSRLRPSINRNSNLEDASFKLGSTLGCSKNAITSPRENIPWKEDHLSFIKEVKDIKSIFLFDRQIGDGKFGTVFLAHPREDLSLNVAIKLIPQKSFNHRVGKELDLLKSIDHVNIIKYLTAYKDKSFFYIVTEYWEGGELFKKIIEHGGIDELEACDIMANLLRAVKFLHDKNICHRDLKPENILFCHDNENTIKIIDFGLSKQLKEGEVMHKKLGTPYYLAPEVLEENYGKEVDLWSLGVVAYVLLCGYPPFYGQDAKELFINIYNVNYGFWEEDWDIISDEAKDFITRLLVKDPKERMTLEEALIHPWLLSLNDNTISTVIEDEVKSNVSEDCGISKAKLANNPDCFSRSAECTTYDSYDKWFSNFTKSLTILNVI